MKFIIYNAGAINIGMRTDYIFTDNGYRTYDDDIVVTSDGIPTIPVSDTAAECLEHYIPQLVEEIGSESDKRTLLSILSKIKRLREGK